MKSLMEIVQTTLDFMQAVGVEVSVAKSPKVRCKVSIAVRLNMGLFEKVRDLPQIHLVYFNQRNPFVNDSLNLVLRLWTDGYDLE